MDIVIEDHESQTPAKQAAAKRVSFDVLSKSLGLSLDKRDVKKTIDLILEWSTYGDLIDLDFKVRKVILHSESPVRT